MKALIYKDLLFLKQNLKTYMVMLVVFFGISIVNRDISNMLVFYFSFVAIMACISTFSYDEYNHWDHYILSSPITRVQVVLAKYLLLILITLSCIIIQIFAVILIGYFQNGVIQLGSEIESLIGSSVGVMMAGALFIPLLYKYGIEKGRLVLFGGAFVVGALGAGLYLLCQKWLGEMAWFQGIGDFFNQFGVVIIPIICLGFFYLSYRVSLHIYKKKEF